MSWLHRLLGADGVTQLGIEAGSKAARVSGRPQDIGARGAYGLAVRSGIMAAGLAADSEIFSARWTDATRVCIPRSIQISVARDTTAFAAGRAIFYATTARGFSTDGSGGTAVVFSTANTNKKRGSFPLSLFTDTGMRFSATAALTAATKTYDTNAFAALTAFISSGATTVPDSWIVPPSTYLWQRNTHDEYPLYYVANEGFTIRATVPITGTWGYTVQFEWAELDPALMGW